MRFAERRVLREQEQEGGAPGEAAQAVVAAVQALAERAVGSRMLRSGEDYVQVAHAHSERTCR